MVLGVNLLSRNPKTVIVDTFVELFLSEREEIIYQVTFKRRECFKSLNYHVNLSRHTDLQSEIDFSPM